MCLSIHCTTRHNKPWSATFMLKCWTAQLSSFNPLPTPRERGSYADNAYWPAARRRQRICERKEPLRDQLGRFREKSHYDSCDNKTAFKLQRSFLRKAKQFRDSGLLSPRRQRWAKTSSCKRPDDVGAKRWPRAKSPASRTPS